MPALSKSQQAVAAIALHSPEKLKNKNVVKMGKESLLHFASTPTKGLPKHKGHKKTKRK
jgi:hypothetical protein